MATEQNEVFLPDYAIPPGETLSETLEALSMTQKEFAVRAGISEKHIVAILKGDGPITPETALKLERVLGVPASFWNNLERNYRDTLARLEEEERLLREVAWLDEVPVSTLAKRGLITRHTNKVKTLQEVLAFYGVNSPDKWRELWGNLRFAARQSPAFENDPGAVTAWMRMGELVAQKIECAPYDQDRFFEALAKVRGLTKHSPKDFQPKVNQWCAEAGVAITFVKEVPGIRLSGITRWLDPKKALIQLSLRYKRDDQLWFTFFHEAGHILKHGKKDMFLENDDGQDMEKEMEADKFAADFLIPPRDWTRFTTGRSLFSKADIGKFASEIGISPGIVVGRLQHEKKIPFTHCNDLKVKLAWVSGD
ncbi:MAG TPA: HigA family addiction module antitoxin [bacterium]|nr:HigA family addiction module antitoxin [bacterium]